MPTNNPGKSTPVYAQILSVLMWLVSAGLGLYAVYYLFKLSTLLYSLFGKDYYTGVLVGQVTTVVAGLIWIASVVTSGEHLQKFAGESRSWRLLGWIIGIEMLLIILGILFG